MSMKLHYVNIIILCQLNHIMSNGITLYQCNFINGIMLSTQCFYIALIELCYTNIITLHKCNFVSII